MPNPFSNILHKEISAKHILRGIFVFFVLITMIAFWVFLFSFGNDLLSMDEIGNEEDDTASTGSCNVSSIPLHGELVTYDMGNENMVDKVASEDITYGIESDEKKDTIKAIILDIDSTGGSPVGAEEIVNALKNAKKPTVALIHETGGSAAYWSATGADTIFASALSDVGSIGITSSYVQNIKNNQKEGFEFISLSTGKHKDVGDPNRPLTDEERALWQADLEKIHEVFVQTVAKNRNMSVDTVRSLATGWSWLGNEALERGLIDKIGGLPEVKEYLKDLIGEDVEICWGSF